ncbi:hypothetical protein ACP4OV_016656 [Aristida adscensionis]
MGFVDPAAPLLATCGGDTVKLFDVSVESGDPCVLAYTPAPGLPVNAVKWNHTNLIVASAGDDKKISLWHKKGQSVGQLPTSTVDRGDDIEECIYSISFSNKGSRYLCSSGSGHIVRIWDLQRKRCIKWLSGHTDTITGVMYNCKDEHLASISMKGDLILHNLASGARTAELSDPNGQVLRVLDYSRNSRHLLATAGDDGSVHLWDTTARSPKVSWLKQHSAPTSGVCISPSSDKIIATVGLDKKLYTLDSGSRRPAHTIPHDAPFSSLAYNDDGTVLAAGTNSGRVVFYDVRGKPQPLTILRAYNSSEAVTSLCWQRAKPVIVNEGSSSEVALLGGTSEESVLMPDPLPSATMPNFPSGAITPSLRSSLTSNTPGFPSTSNSSTMDETPYKTRPLSGGPLSKLQAPRGNYNIKDDMDVFSPLVDVQPFTPSSGSWWDEHGSDDTKKDDKPGQVKLPTTRKFPYIEGSTEPHPIADWRSIGNSKQDGNSSVSTTSMASWKSEPSISSPETSTANALPDRVTQRQQISRFGASAFASGSLAFAGLQDSASTASNTLKGSLTSSILTNLQNKGILSNVHSSLDTSSAGLQSSLPSSYASKIMSSVNPGVPGTSQSTSLWRPSTYSDRMSSASVFSEGLASAFGSPKLKKTGAETKDELLSSLLSRQEAATTSSPASLLTSNGVVPQQLPTSGSTDQQGASSFSLQYVQRMLEESLGSVHKSIHEDVRNLHIELLRQFHMQEMEMSGTLNLVLEKLEGLTKEVQQLRRENQQLRHQLL